MDKHLEIGCKIRLTDFDRPEKTRQGTILNFNASEIVLKFESFQFTTNQENASKNYDVSIANAEYIVKFSSKIVNTKKNILTITKPQDFQVIQRREYTRVQMELPVTIFDKNGNLFNCFSNNVSGGGMQISSSCPLALGELIEAKIKFTNHVLSVVFEVLRIQKNIEKNQYFVSGMFKKIQNVDRIYLIQSCLKKQLEIQYIKS
jgi:c-di-GMP-binding flagellar brake protein YcgR